MTMPRGKREVVALAASVAGIGVSVYLTMLHFAGTIPACPATGRFNCEAVLASPYSVILGTAVPTSAAGMAWFVVSAVLWLRPFGWMQLAWSALGVLTVLYLIFVEIVPLGTICLWCTAGHALVLVIFLIALSLWFETREATE